MQSSFNPNSEIGLNFNPNNFQQDERMVQQQQQSSSSSSNSMTTTSSHSQPWTFTQGFLVGQISVVIVIIVLVRYVIFEDSKTALDKESQLRVSRTSRARQRYLNSISRKSNNNNKINNNPTSTSDLQRQTANTLAEILSKTGYDLSTHSSESLDWLNVVFAQAVAGYRDDVLAGGVGLSSSKDHLWDEEENDGLTGGMREKKKRERSARALMEEILNKKTGGGKMDFLDPISVTEVDFGDQYPILTNARVRPADDTGRMRVEVDLDYSDSITMAIDTKLVINFPKPRFAVLPISLGLTVHRFSGTLAIELCSTSLSSILPTTTPTTSNSNPSSSSASSKKSRHELHFSLHPDFALDATATSLLGSRAKLQDVPKIEQLLVGRLRSWVHDRFVWPRFWSLSLPNLIPSPGTSSNAKSSTNANGNEKNVNEMKTSRGNEFDDINRLNGNVLPPNSIPKGVFDGMNMSGPNHNIPPEQIARFLANRALNGEGSLFEHQDSGSNLGGIGSSFNRNLSSSQNGSAAGSDWNRTLKAQNQINHSRPSFSQAYSSSKNNNLQNHGSDNPPNLPGSLPLDGVKAWREKSSNPTLANGNLSSDGIRQRR